MNAESIAEWLAAIGVPPQVVSIGAEADDAWCLLLDDSVRDDSGEPAPEWEVFWREQGNRYDWARFTNEHVACYYLFGRLAWTQLASGVLQPAVPQPPAEPEQPATAAEPPAPAAPAAPATPPAPATSTEPAAPASPAAAT